MSRPNYFTFDDNNTNNNTNYNTPINNTQHHTNINTSTSEPIISSPPYKSSEPVNIINNNSPIPSLKLPQLKRTSLTNSTSTNNIYTPRYNYIKTPNNCSARRLTIDIDPNDLPVIDPPRQSSLGLHFVDSNNNLSSNLQSPYVHSNQAKVLRIKVYHNNSSFSFSFFPELHKGELLKALKEQIFSFHFFNLLSDNSIDINTNNINKLATIAYENEPLINDEQLLNLCNKAWDIKLHKQNQIEPSALLLSNDSPVPDIELHIQVEETLLTPRQKRAMNLKSPQSAKSPTQNSNNKYNFITPTTPSSSSIPTALPLISTTDSTDISAQSTPKLHENTQNSAVSTPKSPSISGIQSPKSGKKSDISVFRSALNMLLRKKPKE